LICQAFCRKKNYSLKVSAVIPVSFFRFAVGRLPFAVEERRFDKRTTNYEQRKGLPLKATGLFYLVEMRRVELLSVNAAP